MPASVTMTVTPRTLEMGRADDGGGVEGSSVEGSMGSEALLGWGAWGVERCWKMEFVIEFESFCEPLDLVGWRGLRGMIAGCKLVVVEAAEMPLMESILAVDYLR